MHKWNGVTSTYQTSTLDVMDLRDAYSRED
jgi:hypothetical protein